jgi:lambda repressor-like predicted transcriptional regulator
MTTMRNFDDRVWGRFFDFVFPDESNLTRDQIQAELRKQGIDMRQPAAKLAFVLKRTQESQVARAALEAARKRRPSLIARLTGVEVPSGPAIRETLKRMITERLAGPQQAVYARKLESAASDADLNSLLEDISRLEAFSEDSADGES